MSMTAIGGPWSSRPLADGTMAAERLRAFDEAAYKAARRRFLERFSTARQARICHEILVGVEGFLARRGLYARGTAVGQELPALLVVLEIGHHNLAENLFMHGRIENRTQDLDSPVQIARHHVCGGNINRGLRMRQRVTCPEAIDAALLEEAADNGFDADIVGEPFDPGAQAADAAHHQVDGHARSGGLV